MPSLTRDEAAERAALLTVEGYHVDLDLTAAADAAAADADAADTDGFRSTTTVRFSCRRPGATDAGTFVELRPTRWEGVRLNGGYLDPGGSEDNRLRLPDLGTTNELVVRAWMPYSISGEGLHRFIDPEDGRVYLYARSFLDSAQRIFACFDQPDLKAPVTLSVSAPPDWELAGNGAGRRTGPGRWDFATTPPLATYLVSLIAGPYHVLRDQHDGVPLGLYCRRGLAAHLDQEAGEIFEITKSCLDRYHQLFDIRYPFGKYDQAFVPEFNAGAMENPGLVTFRDEFVFRSAVTDSEREDRARVIAHEMAHMWFGDLVTMRWWDDLWLNESFAEYLGFRVTAEATRFGDAWTSFTVGRKGWGYACDQRPSTHPVAPAEVADAGQALLNFDGVSYAKGAAVLRQLAAWLGDDIFLAGLRRLVAAHAFGTVTLDDLLAALSAASGRDLRPWAEVWLCRAQVNTLRPEVSVSPDGTYASVAVVQTAPADQHTLRPHRMGVGLYRQGVLRRRVEIGLEPGVDHGRTEVAPLVGAEVGDLLLLNDGDLTFAKIRFDPLSRSNLVAVLPELADPLARALVWAAAADAVRDAEEPASWFLDLCTAALPTEQVLVIFRDVLRFATANVVDCLLPAERQDRARGVLGRTCLAAVESAGPGNGRRLLAARGYLDAATVGDVPRLRGWLAGQSPEGLVIDSELRWAVIAGLAALGAVSADEIDAEYERDRSIEGAQHAARCRAALPYPASKEAAWRAIVEDDNLPARLVVAMAQGFWQPQQLALARQYVARYFEEMPAMVARRPNQVATMVAERAFPRYAVEPATIAAGQRLLGRPDLSPVLRRTIADGVDELRRCLAARTVERS